MPELKIPLASEKRAQYSKELIDQFPEIHKFLINRLESARLGVDIPLEQFPKTLATVHNNYHLLSIVKDMLMPYGWTTQYKEGEISIYVNDL